MPERFFIIGCQRSGTTLMRLILETHPEIFCYDELKGYAVLQQPSLEPLPAARLVGFKLPRWTEQFTSPVLWDEGLEGQCDRFYRGEKMLFLHRDVRDTVSSMLKLQYGKSNWCEMWVPRIIRAKVAHDGSFRARYARELAWLERRNSPLVALAALYWKYKTESFFGYVDNGFPVLPVAYEQLVMRPRSTLQAVCGHLGVAFHENLLRHNEFQHREVFESGMTLGNTDPRKPIQFNSVGQWARFLSPEDCESIAHIAGDVSARILEYSPVLYSTQRA